MTIQDYETLAQTFRETAQQLRQLGEQIPGARCNSVLFAANLAAGYAELAAQNVDARIETEVIAQIAMEDRHVRKSHSLPPRS